MSKNASSETTSEVTIFRDDMPLKQDNIQVLRPSVVLMI